MICALDRKLLRDLWRMKGQVVAIVAIIACGIAAFVTVVTAYRGLSASRDAYYAGYRMADVFAPVKRAPRAVARDLERVAGVRRVRPRIVFDVTLDLPDLVLPASGRMISVPDRHTRFLNDLHLTAGHWFEGDGTRQAIVADRFAREHGLRPGDRLAVIMNNRKEALRIVATALSPEFVYLIRGGGEILPDAKHFTVLWVSTSFAESVFGFEDACNEFVATLDRGARVRDAIDAFDTRLDRYGGANAYGRRDQLSARSLDDEIAGLEGTATMVPVVFLGVAAFVLHMLMRRLVRTQRSQIALLRALGYPLRTVAGHYLQLALLVGLAGAVLGTATGLWLARGMVELYRDFFSFPRLVFPSDPRILALGFAIALGFAALGAWGAVRAAARLDPARGLHPPAPRVYRRIRLERWPALWRRLGFAGRMIARNLARTRLRSAVTIFGLSMSASILVLAFFGPVSLDVLMDHQFRLVERQDLRIAFHEERGRAALRELARLRGVRMVEGELGVGVRLIHGHRTRRTAISGIGARHALHGLLDARQRPVELPDDGLLLSRKLAELLDVRAGDTVDVQVLTGRRQRFTARVSNVVEEYLGTFAYAELGRLSRWIGEEYVVTGARLGVDPERESELGRELKHLPAVASVSAKRRTLESFKKTIAASQGIMTSIQILFAGIIAFGVIYNAARISFSERQRELGSLRVLGFSRSEVGAVLSGENLLLVVCSLVPGVALGHLFCWLLVKVYDTDLYRFPFVVDPENILRTVAAVLVFAVLANLAVRRRVRRMDLVEVLKARE